MKTALKGAGLPALPSAGYAAAGSRAPEREQASSEALLPGMGQGFALAFLLATLRPSAMHWLGREGLSRLAAPLSMRSPALAALLDTAPPPPAPLSENGAWSGLRVPLRATFSEISWAELSWRADRPAPGRPNDQGSFALRLQAPDHGRIEIRGRLEGLRLDAVMEIEKALPQAVAAELSEAFEAALNWLNLIGTVTVRNGRARRRA
jgi:hypothetical protein